MKKVILLTVLVCVWSGLMAQTDRFCLVKDGQPVSICVDIADWKGVLRAADNLGADIGRVTGHTSPVVPYAEPAGKSSALQNVILAGTIGKSKPIDRLIRQ